MDKHLFDELLESVTQMDDIQRGDIRAMNKNIGSDFDDFLAEQGLLEEINFDLDRMQLAVSGGRFTMPDGMTREEFREWMRDNAGIIISNNKHS